MASAVLVSPQPFPWKCWVLGPAPSLGQHQCSAGNLLGRYPPGLCLSQDLLACTCFHKTLHLQKVLVFFLLALGFGWEILSVWPVLECKVYKLFIWLSGYDCRVSGGCKLLICFCSPEVAGNYRCKTVQATRPKSATKDVPTNPAACWNSWVHVPICRWQLGSCNTHVQLAAKLWIQILHFHEVSKHKRLLSFPSF